MQVQVPLYHVFFTISNNVACVMGNRVMGNTLSVIRTSELNHIDKQKMHLYHIHVKQLIRKHGYPNTQEAPALDMDPNNE